MNATSHPAEDAAACRDTGAPVALLCWQGDLLWWKQGKDGPSEYSRISAGELEGFFREHRDDLSPQTIYRAKTLGRFDSAYQRDFVDLGLMPMVEKEAGVKIERILLDEANALREAIRWPTELSVEQGQWLIKAIFWLLGAKMLHDKEVERFVRIDFGDVGQVFERVARHYGQSAEAIITSEVKRKALQVASNRIAKAIDLRLASTEALAYVYENTLISKEMRKGLGTHSTPSFLIDYIVGRLSPWIAEMKQDDRSVFEPACGHGGFLVAAVRLLTSLLPAAEATPAKRHAYLRQRIQGHDIDSFALEIARLSLTLTDIPNPNGWNLQERDAFASGHLEAGASVSRILLSNPPFEKLNPVQRNAYAKQFRVPMFVSKTAEMLHRCVSALPTGGVFGLVVPQNLLHSDDAVSFRKMMVQSAEFEEICLFPDKVFNFADVESAIIIGRKVTLRTDTRRLARYGRVREGKMAAFQARYEVSSEITVPISRFVDNEQADLRVPDLEEIWLLCNSHHKLEEFAEIGQGFSFIGEDQPNFPEGKKRTSQARAQGFEKGFENLGQGVMSHQLPPTVFLNTDPAIILAKRSGTKTGVKQIVLNEAPIQRAPWCVKPMMDEVGRRATTRFTLCRWLKEDYSLKPLWALFSSPIANAFAYCHSSKRDILTGTWRAFPVPKEFKEVAADSSSSLIKAVDKYLSSVNSFENSFKLQSEDDRNAEREKLKILHWRVDAEIMKLYALPILLERGLLDYFSGFRRAGVPFFQDRYFPADFDVTLSLADYIAITTDWDATNARRLALIQKKIDRNLEPLDRLEFNNLKRLASAKSRLVMPLPNEELSGQESDLKRRGLWVQA